MQHQHFIYADGKLIALNTQTRNANNTPKQKQVRYLHYDALNSVDLITDGYANVVERRSYDTWGKQRKVSWRNSNNPAEVLQQAITNRGYTGHEAITEVGLIHMNGRVYDPELGRFTSADPYIQAPFETNSFNRYSYVWNNPLKYTDPTGYKTFSEWASDAWDSVTDFFSGGGSGSYTNNGNSDGHHANYGYTTYKNGNGFAPSRSVDISWGNDLGFIQGWNSDKCVGSTCTDTFVEAFSFTGLGSVVVGSYDAMHDISDTLDLYSNDKISAGAFGTSVATSIGIAIVERKLKLGGEVADSVYDRVTNSGLKRAEALRDAELEKIFQLSKTKRSKITTVVGAHDPATGRVAVGVKKTCAANAGKCAEDLASEALGNPQNIEFTKVIRPRNEKIIPRCERCTGKYGPED